MRLIDAGKFRGKVIASHCYGGVIKLINIDDVPTAFDVDKVVEQLNDNIMLDIQVNGINRHFIYLEDAIEIVKAGGNIELSEHSKD